MTLLGRWPRPKHSNDRAMTENVLRCCLRTSSASCGSAACDCVGRAVPSSSSRWRRSRRTCAGWPSSSPGRHRCPPQVWRERQVVALTVVSVVSSKPPLPTGRVAAKVAARRWPATGVSHRRLLQQNRPKADIRCFLLSPPSTSRSAWLFASPNLFSHAASIRCVAPKPNLGAVEIEVDHRR